MLIGREKHVTQVLWPLNNVCYNVGPKGLLEPGRMLHNFEITYYGS